MKSSKIKNIGYAKSKREMSLVKLSPYSRFNLILFLSTLIPLILVATINLVVDPYGFFNSPHLPGVNQIQLAKLDHMRIFKAADVTRIKPVTVFLGTSRVETSLNPDHPALEELQPAYNLGLSFSSNYEALRYLEHAIANQPDLKLVVIGVDAFMFLEINEPKPDFAENRLEKSSFIWPDLVNLTLSLSALEKSFDTIQANQNNAADNYFIRNNRPVKKNRVITEEFDRVTKDYIMGYLDVDKSDYAKYTRYDDFQKIVELTQKYNIDLKIFISPVHASLLEVEYQTEHQETLENWKRSLVSLSPISIWDFSGYNSITTEPISNQMQNYEDSSHYTQKVGDLILNRLLNYQTETVPADFGVLLSSTNLEAHLAKIRQDRDLWAQQNPDLVEYIQVNLKNIRKQFQP